MTSILLFASGVAIGVIYQKAILAFKDKAKKAAHAAQEALKQ